jgi:signal transduction histidine kinase
VSLPPDHATIHHESRLRRPFASSAGTKEKPGGERLAQLAAVLDARSFITVPWRQHGRPAGRLYLTSGRAASFGPADIEFLNQVIDQVGPTLDNIRLVDRLATDAADAERQRIARDLHDNVVQPYIGIRMGLAAMRQKLRVNRDVSSDVEQLDEMIGFEIEELRRYLSGLKRRDARSSTFADGLRRFLARFGEATGIEVRVEMPADLQVDDRLAAETFQIVVEALANVRRHTESTDVRVTLDARGRHLLVRVEDTGIPGQAGGGFRPRSIVERAEALGGRVRVEPRAGSGTVMVVEIPL